MIPDAGLGCRPGPFFGADERKKSLLFKLGMIYSNR